MPSHMFHLIKTCFNRLENKMDRIELLLRKNIAEEKKIKKGIRKVEIDEKKIGKNEDLLEKQEKRLLKEVGRIEAEEDWDSGTRFYCRYKILDEGNTIICDKYKEKKLCVFDNCPIK